MPQISRDKKRKIKSSTDKRSREKSINFFSYNKTPEKTMCQGYGRCVALAGKEVSCQWSVSGTCSSPTRIAGGTQILIFTTVAAKAVKGRFSTVNFKAVGSLNIAHQPFSLLSFHVEDFTAFGAGKMDVIFAG